MQIRWRIILPILVLILLFGPFLIPVNSSGTASYREVAGGDASFLPALDIDIHYERHAYQGSTDNPPLILLLHGFGASTYSWREVIAPLSALGEVIAYDRPGFGFTQRPTTWQQTNPYGLEAQIQIIDTFIEHFASQQREVVLIGHSAGGTLAAEYALRNPDSVDALVLVAPAILAGGGRGGWLTALTRIPQVNRLGPLLVGRIASSGQTLLTRSWYDQSKITDEILNGYTAPLAIAGWEKAFWEFSQADQNFSVRENITQLQSPVLLITGDTDLVVATDDSVQLSGMIAGSQIRVLPRTGHLPQEETPLLFLQALSDRWTSLLDGNASSKDDRL
jgi:pimeloyl-ACP methyl ester carboxylesterase